MVEEQTVVVALDGSDQSHHAINWYIDHVHRKGNKVVFVHVVELPELKPNQARGPQVRSIHMSPGVLASMWKEEEAKTKVLEEKMKELLKEKEIPGILRTAAGKPGEVICQVAEEETASMIVTGTRGMGKVRRTILGSVSDYLVHHSHCPVIVCRYPEQPKSRRSSLSDMLRIRHRSGDSQKSRHTSGDSVKSRHASGDNSSRQSSFEKQKSRSESVSSDTAFE